MTTAASLATVDPAAVDAAANYDAVIVYTGTDAGTANEDRDRTTLALPGAQADLINQVAARNPHTVAVMETIGQVDVTGFEPNVPAMLWSSYNGQRKGEALADVLLGNVNPSGHLPFIWYQSIGQIPDITDYAIRPTATSPGRTYMYFRGPLCLPVRPRAELHRLRVLEPERAGRPPRCQRHAAGHRRRQQHGHGCRAARSCSSSSPRRTPRPRSSARSSA